MIVALVYVALAIVLAIPMLVTSVPLGVDDLNHLARIYVRAHIDTDPDLAREFVIKHEWVPYLGADVLLTPLARIFPILVVGRIYTVALALGLVAAVAIVRWVFTSRIGLAPAATGLIAYNGLMAWGFVVYTTGVILALLLFAMWHAWRDRPWVLRLVAFTAASTLLYLTHVVAFFSYGVLVASYELIGRKKPWRSPLGNWIVLIGQALPATILWYNFITRMTILKSDFILKYDAATKIESIVFPFVFRGANLGPDFGVITAVLCEFALILGISRKWLVIRRELFAPAMAMVALSAAAPSALYGEALLDLRFPVLSASVMVAGLQLAPKLPTLTIPIAAVVGMLISAHVADLSILSHQCDDQYSEVREAFAVLPRGAKVITVFSEWSGSSGRACTGLPIYNYMAQLVTIERSGYSDGFFARATSVSQRGNLRADQLPVPPEGFVAPADGFVFWVHWGRPPLSLPGLTLVRRGSFFDIWATESAEKPNPPPVH